jgi:lysophospholipase L1-like esterase
MPENRNRILTFRLILVLFPFLLLLSVEVSLRIFDYGRNLALFVPTSSRFADRPYLLINPRIAERYFPKSYFVPAPTSDGLLREKPKESYRIFVLGESTTAGWPYPNNVMFTRLLQRRLAQAFPGKQIEMVNLGIAAINSFTLLDFIDEVLAQQPDAILIYAGHNEYYGAFGAASTVTLSQTPAFVRLYLWLQRFKTFVLLRDAVNRVLHPIQNGTLPAKRDARFSTLMGQVIGEDHIPQGSDTYARGMAQFKGNLDTLLAKTKAAGMPVMVSDLVSNVHDHAPFFSDRSGPRSAAAEVFQNARRLETQGRVEAARAEYYKAKDLDGLRFRAPQAFNTIIHELAAKHGVPVVPMQSYFEAASPKGLIGNELMLEHLHPNARGHRLMSRAFYETLRKHRFLNEAWPTTEKDPGDFEGFSELDVAIGKIRVLQLTDHWPFKTGTEPDNAVQRYIPQTKAEEVAKDLFLGKFSFHQAHFRMAAYYAGRGQENAALLEYWALTNSAPLDVENYLGVAELLIKKKDPKKAWPFLEASLRLRSTGPDTAQALMDLAAAYVQTDQVGEARRVFARLQQSAPEHPGIEVLAEKLK